jgi:type I restriction enzyme S subunit
MQKLQLTKKYERYPEYKDSGVEWLGEIPAGWETEKLKFFSEISLGKMLQNDDKNGDFFKSYLCAQNIQWEKIDTSTVKEMWFSRNELSKHRIKKGDLLVSEGGEVGRTAIWNDEIEECYVQNSINRVSVKSDRVNSKFLMYAFEGLGKMGIFNLLVNRVSIAHLTSEKLKEVEFIIPDKKEQDKLAAYLDEKVSIIDRTIEGKKKLIELLREKRTAVINEAVTKGLDPKAELIESGVEWIGKIPAGWKMRKVFHIFKKMGSGMTPEDIYLTEDGSGIPWVNTGELTDSFIDVPSKRVKKEALTKYSALKLYPKGSLVIAMYGATIGKLGIVNFDFCSNQACCILEKPNDGFSARYVYYWLLGHKKNVVDLGTGGGQPNINKDVVKSLKISLPKIVEQEKIVEYLDIKITNYDTAIELVKKTIETLQEFKSSLISHVVTGKVRV